MTDTTRTWTFAEDEGGTTSVTIDPANLTIDIHAGPDCDGSTSEVHYVFVARPGDCPWPNETTVRTGPYRSDETNVLCDDPERSFDDRVTRELGDYLRTGWLTSQPEPV